MKTKTASRCAILQPLRTQTLHLSSFVFHHHTPSNHTLRVSGHIVADSLVVEETGDVSDGGNGDILIPQLSLGEAHNILLGDGGDDTLNLLWAHTAAGGDDLASDVLSGGGGAVKGKEDRSLQLSLGALNLSLSNVVRKARPLAKSEVDKVVQTGGVLGDHVDSPKTKHVSLCIECA